MSGILLGLGQLAQPMALLALLGGWPGAWLAQRCFRHKTVKPAFRRIFWLTVVGNLGLILGAARLIARWS